MAEPGFGPGQPYPVFILLTTVGTTKRDNLNKSLTTGVINQASACVIPFRKNVGGRPSKESAHLWLEGLLGFLSANNHKTSMGTGIIIAIFYLLGHGSISFHGRENLMSGLQCTQMFSVLQFSTVKCRITGTKRHDIKEQYCIQWHEKVSVNYILLDKYLNSCIIFAIYMSLPFLYFKKSTVHTNDISCMSSNKINVD